MKRYATFLVLLWLCDAQISPFEISDNLKTCNNAKQDKEMCKTFEIFSMLDPDTILPIVSNYLFGNAIGEIPEELKQLMTLNKCTFDSFSDKSIAKSFKFILFKPNTKQPEYINGIDLLHNCNALKSSVQMVEKTIWIWPGWLSNCTKVKAFGDDFQWTFAHAPELAKQAQAQVVVIDWGSSDLSCCSYPQLVFCHQTKISDWMAKIINKCSKHGASTSKSNTWLIGHSLGAQFAGFTAKKLSKTGSKVEKLIGLDPSGPLFAKNENGKCHGIEKGHADQTMHFITNPGQLGVENVDIADVRILCNSKREFCQPGCNCNDMMCNHFYARGALFEALVLRKQLQAQHVRDKTEIAHVSIFDKMKPGVYDLDSYEILTLKVATSYEKNEL